MTGRTLIAVVSAFFLAAPIVSADTAELVAINDPTEQTVNSPDSRLALDASNLREESPRWLIGLFLGYSSAQGALDYFTRSPSFGARLDGDFLSLGKLGSLGLEVSGAFSRQGNVENTYYTYEHSFLSPPLQSIGPASANTSLVFADVSLKISRRITLGWITITPKIGAGPDLQSFSATDPTNGSVVSKAAVYGLHALLGVDIGLGSSIVVSADTRRCLYAKGEGYDSIASSDTIPAPNPSYATADRSRFDARVRLMGEIWVGAEFQMYQFETHNSGALGKLYLGQVQMGF